MSGGKTGKVKETAEEKELASIGAQRWARYQEKWKPVRDAFIADVRNGEDEMRNAQSMAGANVASAFSRKRKGAEDALSSAGLGSGRFNLGMGGLYRDQGKSMGLTQVDTKQAAADARLATMESLIGAGQGQAGGAIQGLSQVAGLSARQAEADARNAAANRAAMGEAVGTAAGLGMYAYGKKDPYGPPVGQPYEDVAPSGSPTALPIESLPRF